MLHREISGRQFSLGAAAFVVMAGIAGDARGHEEIEIGQNGSAGHAYVLHSDPGILSGDEAIGLQPEIGGDLDGYFIHDGPAFRSVAMDEPAEGLFRLLPGHQTSLVRVAFEPGFTMLNPATFEPLLPADGDHLQLNLNGVDDFNRVFIYAMVPGTPAGVERTASFLIRDMTGLHADSSVFTLRFVAVPEPGAGALALLGVLALRYSRLWTR